MKAIILAAGVGKRIASVTRLPKSLLEIEDKSLMERHVENLFNFGVDDINIVVGYKKEYIINHLQKKFSKKKVNFIKNPKYTEASGYSFYLARQIISGSEIITMDADVCYHPQILKSLIEAPEGSFILAGQRDEYISEEYVITLDEEGVIREFQRASRPTKFEIVGEWVGFCRFTKEDSAVVVDEIDSFFKAADLSVPYEDILENSIKRIKARPIYTNGLPWTEIDFKEDYEMARKLVFK